MQIKCKIAQSQKGIGNGGSLVKKKLLHAGISIVKDNGKTRSKGPLEPKPNFWIPKRKEEGKVCFWVGDEDGYAPLCTA